MKIAINWLNFDDLLGPEYQNQADLCLILHLLNIGSVVGGYYVHLDPYRTKKSAFMGI